MTEQYFLATFKKPLKDGDFAKSFEQPTDYDLQDRPIVHHEWGYKIHAKQGAQVYVLKTEPYEATSDRIEVRNKQSGEVKFIRSYERYCHPTAEWEDTGKVETDTYRYAGIYLLFWGGFVASMNTLAAQQYLTAKRVNGQVVFDTTGAAAKAHERYRYEMSR